MRRNRRPSIPTRSKREIAYELGIDLCLDVRKKDTQPVRYAAESAIVVYPGGEDGGGIGIDGVSARSLPDVAVAAWPVK